MDNWEKSKAVGSLTASVLIPVVLLVVGNGFSHSVKEKELALKYVELATGILKEEPKENTKDLREWAARVISHHSEIRMDNESIDELQNNQLEVFETETEFNFYDFVTENLNNQLNFPGLTEEEEDAIIENIVIQVIPLIEGGYTIEEVYEEINLPLVAEQVERTVVKTMFELYNEYGEHQ